MFLVPHFICDCSPLTQTTMESKVIIASSAASRRSQLVFLLKASVNPYTWRHPFIPILPASIGDGIMDSPVPCLVAVRQLPFLSACPPQNECVALQSSDPLAHHCTRCSRHMSQMNFKLAKRDCIYHTYARAVATALQFVLSPKSSRPLRNAHTPQSRYADEEILGAASLGLSPSPSMGGERLSPNFDLMRGTAAVSRSASARNAAVDAWLWAKQETAAPLQAPTDFACCRLLARTGADISSADIGRWHLLLDEGSDAATVNVPPFTRGGYSLKRLTIPSGLSAIFSEKDELFSLDHSSPRSDGDCTVASPACDRSSCVPRSPGAMSPPWALIVEGHRMSPIRNANYLDDFREVLTRHSEMFLPLWYHQSSPFVKSKAFLNDAELQRIRISPLLPCKGGIQ